MADVKSENVKEARKGVTQENPVKGEEERFAAGNSQIVNAKKKLQPSATLQKNLDLNLNEYFEQRSREGRDGRGRGILTASDRRDGQEYGFASRLPPGSDNLR